MDRQARTVTSTCLPSTVTARNGEGNAPASLSSPQGKAEAGQLDNLFGMVRVVRAKYGKVATLLILPLVLFGVTLCCDGSPRVILRSPPLAASDIPPGQDCFGDPAVLRT